ncbi:MAG TPA: hypothetical protein VI197_18960 [Polyangiaceae bacterium]
MKCASDFTNSQFLAYCRVTPAAVHLGHTTGGQKATAPTLGEFTLR